MEGHAYLLERRGEESNFSAHTNAQAQAADTFEAITMFQTCLWENCVGFLWVGQFDFLLLPFLINALTLHIFLARTEEPKLKSPQRPFREACWVVRCGGQNKADLIFQN